MIVISIRYIIHYSNCQKRLKIILSTCEIKGIKNYIYLFYKRIIINCKLIVYCTFE
jgi:hypothetical protein